MQICRQDLLMSVEWDVKPLLLLLLLMMMMLSQSVIATLNFLLK